MLYETVLISLLVAARAAEDCSLQQLLGQWYDPINSNRNAQFIFKFDPDYLLAVTPNLAWTTGTYNFNKGSITANLDNGETIQGNINTATCDEIYWTTPKANWTKIPQVDDVHVVFMNHLDVGYNGIEEIGFINNVLNKYFKVYYPRAIRLGQTLNKEQGFIYTTHPWLLDMYLNCPKDFVLNGVELYCPTDDELESMQKAIQNGRIVWHAGPMNMQIELMNRDVLNASLKISQFLDENFRPLTPTRVLSQRDVPGLTAAAIPVLIDNGIQAVSVGVNPSSAPPAVPKIFQWKQSTDSKESIIGMWNAGGYPLNPGNSLSHAGGLSLFDSTIALADRQALVFAFRTDNSGPPVSIEEVHQVYDILERQFEGANVFASSLDNFIKVVSKEKLPLVVGEIGDTWIQGIASDPVKMAQYRYSAKALQLCVVDNQCGLDENELKYLRFLVKLPEHTWGLPTVFDETNWSNENFEKHRAQKNFQDGENSWSEQRVFFDATRNSSREAVIKNYNNYLERILAENNSEPFELHLNNLKWYEKDIKKANKLDYLGIPANISFSADGSVLLQGRDENNKLIVFSDKDNGVGTFTYHTYNQSDYDFVNAQYGYYGNAGYNKPNVTANANPQSGKHYGKLILLYQRENHPSFCALLQIDNNLHRYYGGPAWVWNCIEIQRNPNQKLFPFKATFKLSLLEKVSTRLPEATMYWFTPKLQTPDSKWSEQIFKVDNYRGNDKIPTGGITLDSIVKNGSFYQHAVEELYLVDQKSQLVFNVKSTEVPLVCPVFDKTTGFETPNPLPILSRPDEDSKLRGFAFNVHNNVWNTNYPLWFPFNERMISFRSNFEAVWYQV